MKIKAVVVLLTAVLAAVGWICFGPAWAVDPAPHAPAADTKEQRSSPGAEPAPESVPLGASPTAVGDGAERMVVVPAAPPPLPTASHFEVHGRLVDPGGSPRAGITLGAETWVSEGMELDGLPFGPGMQRSRPDAPLAVTDAGGRFRFEFAKERSGTLFIQGSELVFQQEAPRFVGNRGTQDLGDVVAQRAGSLHGVVRDDVGQPVAGVGVVASLGVFGATSEAKTADDGTFTVTTLRAGKWTLRTMSSRFLPAVEEVTLAAEEQRQGLVLIVRAGNAIAGQVVDERGVGVAGMRVGCKRKEQRGSVDIESFAVAEATATNEHGYFTLAGLADQVATVRATGPGHTTVVQTEVPVGTGNLVLRVERLGVVEGVLQGADGTPIAGSRVSASARSGTADGLMMIETPELGLDTEARTTTQADGSFRIENVTPGVVVVAARGSTHRPLRQPGVRVMPGQVAKGVRLVADQGAIARVTVIDDGGKPVADAAVTVRRVGAPGRGDGTFFARRVEIDNDNDNGDVRVGTGDGPLGSAKTDAEGLAVVMGLPAGEVEVVGKHAQLAASTPVRVTLPRSGTIEATVELRRPGFAEIRVTSVDAGAVRDAGLIVRSEAANTADEPIRAKTDERGLVRVGPLSSGDYTVTLTRPAEPLQIGDVGAFATFDSTDMAGTTKRFTIVAEATTRVELVKPTLTRVHGTVTGVDGPIADAIVSLQSRDGDEVDIGGLGGGRNATTGAHGDFAIDDVEPGSYVLRYGKRSQVVKASREIHVPTNATELRQDLELRTGSLRVQAVAMDGGDPISGADVDLEAAAVSTGTAPRRVQRVMMFALSTSDDRSGDTTTMTMGDKRVRTDEDGFAEIEDVPAGTYTLRLTHRRHAAAELKNQVVAERQRTESGRVQMAAAGTIRGKVMTSDGKPANMARVQSRKVGATAWGGTEMAAGGSFRLTGLEGGKYEIRAQALGGPENHYSPVQEVEVVVGETATAQLTLPPQ